MKDRKMNNLAFIYWRWSKDSTRRTSWFRAVLFGVTTMLFANTVLANQQTIKVRRFALLVGTNDGGTSRMKLRYANKDAASMQKVLTDLGGVFARDVILLKQATLSELNAGFQKMAHKLNGAKKSGVRLEVVFYYSGHSNESGLMLNGDHLTYQSLRKMINSIAADVKVVVVDSCASGAMTRQKGGKKRAPFVVDASADVKGIAILTSASEEESAQESDVVEGSFFTHYFISGLRGAADTTRDGKVTLNEAYVYAFHETLARTEVTRSGAQHANYDFQLTGSGDIVLTDLRDTSASMRFSSETQGRIFIRNKNGMLVAEISKAPGAPVVFGLAPGRYEIILDGGGQLYGGSVVVAKGHQVKINMASFRQVSAEHTGQKHAAQTAVDTPTRRPVSMGVFPGVSTDGGAIGQVINHFSLNLMGLGDHLKGMEVGSIGNGRRGNMKGAQLAGILNFVNKHADGFQFSGIGNVVGKDVRGSQLSGVFNVTGRDMAGIQFTGVANVAGGDVRGVQITAGTNWVSGEIRGLQLGLVNYGEKVHGVQIGLVNIASKEMKGGALGLVNYAGDGILAPTAWVAPSSLLNIGLKVGSKYMYTLWAAGFHPAGDEKRASLIGGIGGHIQLKKRGWLEIEILHHWLHAKDTKWWDDHKTDLLEQLRVNVGMPLSAGFSVYGGLSFNVLISEVRDEIGLKLHFFQHSEVKGTNVTLSPGFTFGFQWQPPWGGATQTGERQFH